MTQWLIEEAAFTALEVSDALAERRAMEQSSEDARLLSRAAELREMAARQVRRAG